MGKRKRRRLPAPDRRPHALMGLTIESYTVGSWCPTPDGSGPATAVGVSLQVVLHDQRRADLVLRLKAPEAVDRMIQSLLRHKRDVWPDAP